MAVNQVIYNGNILVNLTSDTVDSGKLLSGETAHDKAGNAITGELVVQNYHVGVTEPEPSLGQDGDVYLVTGV